MMSMRLAGQWLILTSPILGKTPLLESLAREVRNATDEAFKVATEPRSVDLVIAEIPIRLRATDPGLLAAFSDALTHHVVPKSATSPNTPSVEIRLWSASATGISRPKMPEGMRQRVMARRADLAPSAGYHVDYDATGRILTMMYPNSGSVDVCLSDIANLPQWEKAAPLRSALGWILRRSDRHLLHAAAVTNSHGGALLLGAGGAGKSTTSLNCRQEGMGFLGDDICVIDANPTPRIFNIYGTAKTVWSDRGRFPELDQYLVTDPTIGDYKAVYTVNKSEHHRIVDSGELRVLVLIDRSLPVGEWEPIDPARVVALVASTTASFLPGSGRPMLAALSEIARRIPVIRLSVGQDPKQVAALISSAIDNAITLPRDSRVC
jgi:hypothetical protein